MPMQVFLVGVFILADKTGKSGVQPKNRGEGLVVETVATAMQEKAQAKVNTSEYNQVRRWE